MRLFDTHAHINDEKYDNDRESMIQGCFDAGVEYILIPGVEPSMDASAIALTEQYDNVYCAVGTHPHEASGFTDATYDYYKDLVSKHDKIRAIGEIGLDYFYDFSPRNVQQNVFIRQLALAREVDLPIIIHDRDAHGDTLRILQEYGKGNYGIFHCYSGSLEFAKEVMKLGFYISFAGPVAFPKSTKLKEVAKDIPLDRILVETDSPYLTPPPFRGRRNDPSKVQYVAQEIATLKGMDSEEFAAIALDNGKRIFRIQ